MQGRSIYIISWIIKFYFIFFCSDWGSCCPGVVVSAWHVCIWYYAEISHALIGIAHHSSFSGWGFILQLVSTYSFLNWRCHCPYLPFRWDMSFLKGGVWCIMNRMMVMAFNIIFLCPPDAEAQQFIIFHLPTSPFFFSSDTNILWKGLREKNMLCMWRSSALFPLIFPGIWVRKIKNRCQLLLCSTKLCSFCPFSLFHKTSYYFYPAFLRSSVISVCGRSPAK